MHSFPLFIKYNKACFNHLGGDIKFKQNFSTILGETKKKV